MLSLNPTTKVREKVFSRGEIAEALRLAVIAELDAINLYEQIASLSEDEVVRKVFLDVAKEEKTHVGEFLAILLKFDPGQAEEIKSGFEEVRELTGIKSELGEGNTKSANDGNPRYLEVLKDALLRGLENSRVLLKSLPRTEMIGSQTFRVDVIKGDGEVKVVEREYKPISLLTQKFYIGMRELDDGSFDEAVATKSGEELAKKEEELILREFLSVKGANELELKPWDSSEEALENLMDALQVAAKFSAGPFGVILSPKRFVKLLKVYEKSGKMLVEVLREVFRGGIIVTPNIEDDMVVVFANTPSVLDVVVGQEVDVKELGPEGDSVAFLVSEALGLRVKSPESIVILKK